MDSAKIKKLGPEALFEYAVKLLARRPLTERELLARIAKKARVEMEAERAVERVRALGYLDDLRTAESHAYGRREFQGFGRRRVLEELKGRGVDDSEAERAVAETYAEVDEADLIRQYLKRRMPSVAFEEPKQGKRAVERLLRAGFGSGKILEVLRQLAAGAEWIDELDEADLEPPSEPA